METRMTLIGTDKKISSDPLHPFHQRFYSPQLIKPALVNHQYMNEETELPGAAAKPGDDEVKKTSLLRTLVSLALFIAIYYWIFQSWFAVVSLVAVIIFHEAGHFAAMKFFGYKSVNMTFVPFVGAYVSGQATDLSRKNKLIVLLAGPVPGIILGCILFYLYLHYHERIYLQLSMPFLLLNVFNLLPVFPLDGGQFFQTLFFTGSRIFQLFFLYVSIAVLIYLFVKLNYSWPLLFIALLVFYRIGVFILSIRSVTGWMNSALIMPALTMTLQTMSTGK
ncbi:MAG: hypothetical protein IPP72_01545 [Chitinophagaceae bacterium]|nr:hypothetical protein [Chitinophagaceae bacterium]